MPFADAGSLVNIELSGGVRISVPVAYLRPWPTNEAAAKALTTTSLKFAFWMPGRKPLTGPTARERSLYKANKPRSSGSADEHLVLAEVRFMKDGIDPYTGVSFDLPTDAVDPLVRIIETSGQSKFVETVENKLRWFKNVDSQFYIVASEPGSVPDFAFSCGRVAKICMGHAYYSDLKAVFTFEFRSDLLRIIDSLLASTRALATSWMQDR